ncbi:helix-turn-helix transcriptional regulator [Wenyingzhuangia sp. 1_MG-2023]|nr:helix-turn-helix transcriptional regulator [Wenyingzhuangia sp. 1_MG-2023]
MTMNVKITASNTIDTLEQIQSVLGGVIEEKWGEFFLKIDNEKAKGTIRFIAFDRGVSLLDYDIVFYEEVLFSRDTSFFNPIRFSYCMEGNYGHFFEKSNSKTKIEQYQAVIVTGKDGGHSCTLFAKNVHVKLNVIQVLRNKFVASTDCTMEFVNEKLYEVFYDKDHDNKFAYYGTYNLKMADKINAIYNIKKKGILRMLTIEGKVYEILSMHISQHNQEVKGEKVETTLLKEEIKLIRKYSRKIIKTPDVNYTLESISEETGLTQAKLQEGFKLIYSRTVTEYIRHIRLEKARELMNTTDCNVSQVAYTVGFSSRSYFSKIFKSKYKVSPSEYLKLKQKKTILQTGVA